MTSLGRTMPFDPRPSNVRLIVSSYGSRHFAVGQVRPTSDNPHLSRLKIGSDATPEVGMVATVERRDRVFVSADICTNASTSKVEAYNEAGIAPATRRAYPIRPRPLPRLGRFCAGHGCPGRLLSRRQCRSAHVATLTRRLAAISVAHEAHKLPNPVQSPLVRATIRGIRREHGVAQRQAKPLLRDDLFDVLATMGDRPKDLRDRSTPPPHRITSGFLRKPGATMPQPTFDAVDGERDAPSRSHSSSFDQRRRPETLRTAIAMAFFWPTRTTSRLPRVMPV